MKEEKTLLNATLCFLVKEDSVLLGMKAKKIGEGCWNGYGGGVDEEETPEESVTREVFEELGVRIIPEYLEKMAIINFHNTKSDESVFVCKVHVYLAYKWEGEPRETEEMLRPTWFDKKALPLEGMMPSDKEWLPLILNGKKIIAEIYLGPFQKELLKEVEINYVDSFHS